MGQPEQTNGKIGEIIKFSLFEKFITTKITNEPNRVDSKLFAVDLANARYFDGNGIGMMSSDEQPSKTTLRKNGGRDWIFNEDGSISPNRSGFGLSRGEWVLGVKLVAGGKGFTVGGGNTY